jgi:hypothetical protein
MVNSTSITSTEEPILLENQRFCLLVFDSEREVILEWLP